MSDNKKKYINFFVIIVLVSLAYSNSFNNSFHYDDIHSIVKNPYIRYWSNTFDFFRYPYMFSMDRDKAMYRPLLLVTYTFNYWLDGYNVWSWHLANFIFHILNVLLITGIASFLFKGAITSYDLFGIPGHLFFAIIAGLVYGIHPVNTEPVNYISSRSDVMSTSFYLLGFYLFLQFVRYDNRNGARIKRLCIYIVSLTSYLLGLFTKENAITLPVILFIYDYIFNRSDSDHGKVRYSLLRHIPYWLTTILYLFIRKVVTGGTGLASAIPLATGKAVTVSTGLFNRTLLYQLTQIKVVLNYLRLWLVPVGLNVEHGYPLITSLSDPGFILSLIFFVGLILLIIYLYRFERRFITFFSLWFFVASLPTSLLPLNIVMADKRLYLPGVGLTVITGFILYHIYRLFKRRGLRDGIFISFLIVLITTFSIGTWERNKVWESEYTLWKDAAEKSPYASRAYNNLGKAYLDMGEVDKAKVAITRAIVLKPDNYSAYSNLGLVYTDEGLYNRAEDAFKKAIELKPRFASSYYNLGHLYVKMGDLDRALEAFKRSVEIRPRFSFAHNNIGNIYWLKGEKEKAIAEYREALKIDPMNTAAKINLMRILGE